MLVLVTGGTGYIGQVVVQHLCNEGHRVRVLQRPSTRRPLSNLPVEVVTGDLFDEIALERAVVGVDAIVHLVGIIRENKRRNITMHRIHVDGTRNLIRAAQASVVGHFLHMSAQGARDSAPSAYHRSKWEAEQLVRASGLTYTIFRPSVVFGRGGPGPEFIGQLKQLARFSPLVPVIGDGRFWLQPVSVQTVAAAFTASLTNPKARNQLYEVGGPQVLSYLDILKMVCASVGRPFLKIRVPIEVMKTLVPVMQSTPGFPITNDQLCMLLEGNTTQNTDRMYTDLSLDPIPFAVE